jgi:surface antigen
VSFDSVVSRVAQIQAMEQLLLGGQNTSASGGPTTGGGTPAGSAGQTFAQVLGSATATGSTATTTPAATSASAPSASANPASAAQPPSVSQPTDYGARALAVAEGEIGQAEQPPGSNDSPRIATYRAAVQGSVVGQPWCAYFVSWCAAQAGVPLGDHGQGFGAVSQIEDWARSSGRLLPASAKPRPGDLILFGTAHVGMVESVAADGTITTVEGNTGDAVRRRVRSPGEATGFVRLGPPGA